MACFLDLDSGIARCACSGNYFHRSPVVDSGLVVDGRVDVASGGQCQGC